MQLNYVVYVGLVNIYNPFSCMVEKFDLLCFPRVHIKKVQENCLKRGGPELSEITADADSLLFPIYVILFCDLRA